MDPYREKGERRREEIRQRDKKNFKEAMTGGKGGGAAGCSTIPIVVLTIAIGLITVAKIYFS